MKTVWYYDKILKKVSKKRGAIISKTQVEFPGGRREYISSKIRHFYSSFEELQRGVLEQLKYDKFLHEKQAKELGPVIKKMEGLKEDQAEGGVKL